MPITQDGDGIMIRVVSIRSAIRVGTTRESRRKSRLWFVLVDPCCVNVSVTLDRVAQSFCTVPPQEITRDAVSSTVQISSAVVIHLVSVIRGSAFASAFASTS